MRILLSWKKWEKNVSYLVAELEKAGHEVVYWVGFREHFDDVRSVSGAICHDKDEAMRGIYAEAVSPSDVPSASRELVEALYETESVVLTIMSRRLGMLNIEERKHIYYERLAYWYYVLNTYKPDVIIYDDVPHNEYNYILYGLAKLRGLHTIMFQKIRMANRWLLINRWEVGSTGLTEAFDKNKQASISSSDVPQELLDYVTLKTEPRKDTLLTLSSTSSEKDVWALFGQMKWHGWRFLSWLKRAIVTRLHQQPSRHDVMGMLNDVYRAEYGRLESQPDFSVPFVFFALHMQPERNTAPQGYAYSDQVLAIETISKALPEGWYLYVKEHPNQWWARKGKGSAFLRYPGYYERIARLPNVKLVPIATDVEKNAYQLIEKARVVSTITGTAGFEALFRKKPVFIFGVAWYKDCPGVFTIDSVSTCKKAFATISQKEYHVSDEDILRFLKSFDEVAIRGYVKGGTRRQTEQEGIDTMIDAIRKDLTKHTSRSA